MEPKLLLEHLGGEESLANFANLLIQVWQNDQEFRVWFDAPMGAGKTTLMRHILHALGLPEDQPVQSPTYTLMNDYEIAGSRYAHLDLYRIQDEFRLDDLGLDSGYRGIFIEWPHVAMPEASYHLKIEPLDGMRRYQLYQFTGSFLVK